MTDQEYQIELNHNNISETELMEKERIAKIIEDEEDAKKMEELLNFTKMKKKKRKPKILNTDEKNSCEEKLDEDNIVDKTISTTEDEPNYDYALDLLPRLYKQLEDHFEKEGLSNKEKLIFKPIGPVITQVGGKRSKFSNYEKFTKSFQTLNIELRMQHMKNFLDKELCCTSNYANSVLTFHSKLQLARVQNVLISYLANYVKCETCGNLNTLLKKCNIANSYNIKCDNCISNPKYLVKI